MPRLSKSRIVAGQQCPTLLWWRVHEADAPELIPDERQQGIFDSGHRVGAAAIQAVPGGVLIADNADRGQMVRDTQAALEAGAQLLYEASFTHDGVFVAVDVLERIDEGWCIAEVKSTTQVKPQHVLDAAVQLHVLRGAGLRVDRVELMHLNKAHRSHGTLPLFQRTDITDQVVAKLPTVRALIPSLREVLAGDQPEPEPGARCKQPYRCPFFERCNAPPPPGGLSELYRVRQKVIGALQADGVSLIRDIPADVDLPAIARRQRRAMIAGHAVTEPTLGGELKRLHLPAVFIDFEAIAPALPPWQETRPYGQIPVQVSVHRVEVDGTTTHQAWLAQSGVDPRPELAAFVLDACASAETLVAYHASFETQMFHALSGFLAPEDGARLLRLKERFVDLLPMVRNQVYHPDFRGSFSLKKVLPALVPAAGYGDLEVQDGAVASMQLEGLLIRDTPPPGPRREAMRAALLAYCERDTDALVALWRALAELAEAGPD